MRSNDIVRLWNSRGISVGSPAVPHSYPEMKETNNPDNKNRVLMEVFAIDDLTGKPMNDLVLTSNTRLSPEVREFIKQNLQAPVEAAKASADYEISEELCRKDTESVFEYQQRLRQMTIDGLEYVKETTRKVSKHKK